MEEKVLELKTNVELTTIGSSLYALIFESWKIRLGVKNIDGSPRSENATITLIEEDDGAIAMKIKIEPPELAKKR